MTSYESIYPGATYLLDPSYNFMGYRVDSGNIGATTSIQTANQLKEVSNLLNQGYKETEVSVINADVFEMMPEDHLKEINRLNKLTGATSSVHAPLVEPSGFTEQGWSEENRELAEIQLKEFISRSHDLDPQGNIPVTIHSTQIPGSERIPESHKLVRPDEKGKGPIYGRIIAVDQESGQFIPLRREKMFRPGGSPEGKIYTPEERLEIANASKFTSTITNLAFYKKEADEILVPTYAQLAGIMAKDKITQEDFQKNQGAIEKMSRANLFLENVEMSFRNFYEQIAKYGDEEAKKQMQEISQNWAEKQKLIQQKMREDPIKAQIEIPIIKSNLLDDSMRKIQEMEMPDKNGKSHMPEFYKKAEEFATNKASETFSEVALNAYKKFGDTAPIVSIENPPYGSAISSGKDLKNLIVVTRKKFADKLVNEGKSRTEAEKAASKLIGATWDTSHINMIRKQGFDKNQIVRETKDIAPFVKHLHFNDNFGSTHTDLPPGMGSVPMKDVLKELEKEKFKGKRIFEGGNFFQHFRTSPFPYILESTGSPMYEMGGSPYWNQVGTPAGYYNERGSLNPGIHHRLYGSRFETLPLELGGNVAGNQGRFSGTPNQ